MLGPRLIYGMILDFFPRATPSMMATQSTGIGRLGSRSRAQGPVTDVIGQRMSRHGDAWTYLEMLLSHTPHDDDDDVYS